MKNLLKFKAKAIICISILLISASAVFAQEKIAIIDAGSSGSRLWVYEYDASGGSIIILFPKNIKEEAIAKGPALSTVAPNKNDIEGFLDSMTSKYSKYNEETDKKIPLYVLATAGMRMIPEVKANSIYELMNQQGKKIGENFSLVTAMTISGQYEGLYAWIAANYKDGRIGINNNKMTIKENTVGIIEIGGASMQIAFIMNQDGTRKHFDNVIEDDSLGKIYSKSYLHYGADRVFERLGTSLPPACLVPLDKIDNLYNAEIQFIGLSNPINKMFEEKHQKKYSELKLNITEINEKRKEDSYSNYHPAINNLYIDWVLGQLGLSEKLQKQEESKTSDWTLGAALDILINKQEPQGFNYYNPN